MVPPSSNAFFGTDPLGPGVASQGALLRRIPLGPALRLRKGAPPSPTRTCQPLRQLARLAIVDPAFDSEVAPTFDSEVAPTSDAEVTHMHGATDRWCRFTYFICIEISIENRRGPQNVVQVVQNRWDRYSIKSGGHF